MNYDLEVSSIINEIRKKKVKTVLLQFPDGLKPEATIVAEQIEKATDATVMIWTGSCFGACDIPQAEADMIIQFGHSRP